jgi:hypothetical protein
MATKYTRRTQLYPDLKAHILAGKPTKEWAFENQMHRTAANTIANRLGFRKHYLTDEELAHIMKRRKAAN